VRLASGGAGVGVLCLAVGAAGLAAPWSAGIAPLFATSISLAERRMAISGQVTGWFLVGASLGSMSVPWLIGQLFESVGPRVAMVIILVDMILALGVFVVIKLGFSRLASDSGEQTKRPI